MYTGRLFSSQTKGLNLEGCPPMPFRTIYLDVGTREKGSSLLGCPYDKTNQSEHSSWLYERGRRANLHSLAVPIDLTNQSQCSTWAQNRGKDARLWLAVPKPITQNILPGRLKEGWKDTISDWPPLGLNHSVNAQSGRKKNRKKGCGWPFPVVKPTNRKALPGRRSEGRKARPLVGCLP